MPCLRDAVYTRTQAFTERAIKVDSRQAVLLRNLDKNECTNSIYFIQSSNLKITLKIKICHSWEWCIIETSSNVFKFHFSWKIPCNYWIFCREQRLSSHCWCFPVKRSQKGWRGKLRLGEYGAESIAAYAIHDGSRRWVNAGFSQFSWP